MQHRTLKSTINRHYINNSDVVGTLYAAHVNWDCLTSVDRRVSLFNIPCKCLPSVETISRRSTGRGDKWTEWDRSCSKQFSRQRSAHCEIKHLSVLYSEKSRSIAEHNRQLVFACILHMELTKSVWYIFTKARESGIIQTLCVFEHAPACMCACDIVWCDVCVCMQLCVYLNLCE